MIELMSGLELLSLPTFFGRLGTRALGAGNRPLKLPPASLSVSIADDERWLNVADVVEVRDDDETDTAADVRADEMDVRGMRGVGAGNSGRGFLRPWLMVRASDVDVDVDIDGDRLLDVPSSRWHPSCVSG